MRKRISTICAALVLLGAMNAGAQTSGAGPYFPTPSWDLVVPCPSAASCPRFIVLTNIPGAVLDAETGLVWQRTPADPFSFHSWAAAQAVCNSLAVGNRLGWRLPTIHELTSLVDPAATGTLVLPPGHPFLGLDHLLFWSSTTDPGNNNNALQVLFTRVEGRIFSAGTDDKTDAQSNTQLCVRGGVGVAR